MEARSVKAHTWTQPVPEHIRNSYGLLYVTAGSGFFSIDGGCYQVNHGDVFIYFPLEDHGYVPDPVNGISVLFLKFELSDEDTALARDLRLLNSNRVFPSGEAGSAFFLRISELLSDPNAYRRSIAGFEIGAFLYDIISRYKYYPSSEKCNLFDDMIEYLYSDFSIKLGDIARDFKVSEEYVRQLFHKYVGVSPMHYILRYRIEYVAQYLATTDLTLAELAEKFCFSDEFHLIRMFKKYRGITPRHFQKISRSDCRVSA
jgi:AraC-like DNA-binding protein